MRTLVAVLGIFAFGCAYAPAQVEPQTPFEAVCEHMTCAFVKEPPVVVTTQLILDHPMNAAGGLRGLHYRGEKYVFVNPFLPADLQYEVTVHEIVHYVGVSLGITDMCESEAMARAITRDITGSYDPTWAERYGCA